MLTHPVYMYIYIINIQLELELECSGTNCTSSIFGAHIQQVGKKKFDPNCLLSKSDFLDSRARVAFWL